MHRIRPPAAQARVAAFSITAPFNCVVAEVSAKTGNPIQAGAPVVQVASYLCWVVKSRNLTGIDVVKVRKGQSIFVVFDAIPGTKLEGKVTLGQEFSDHPGDVVYEVTVMLARRHPALRWGMTAKVKFK